MKRWEGLLGLGARGGKLVFGRLAIERGFRRGGVHLVVLASDAGEVVQRRISRLCAEMSVPLAGGGQKDHLGRLAGRAPCAAVGVADAELAGAIMRSMGNEGEPFGVPGRPGVVCGNG